MLNKTAEEDFYELQCIARGRLSPDGISAFLLFSMAITGLVALMTLLGVCESPTLQHWILWKYIAITNIVIFVLHIIFAILFLNMNNAFRFQKLQSVLLSFFGFLISVDFYQIYFYSCDYKQVPSPVRNIGAGFFIVGIILLFILTIRAVIKVKRGTFKEGGEKLYKFQRDEEIFTSLFNDYIKGDRRERILIVSIIIIILLRKICVWIQ